MTSRRILAVVLAVLMLLSMMPTAFAHAYCPDVGLKCKWSKWQVVQKAEDCQSCGVKQRQCKVCGDTVQDEYLGDHKWGSWKTTKEPTCVEEGKRERKCKVCGTKDKDTISAGAHEWSEWEIVQEAAENQAGIRERKCKLCGKVQREEFYPEGTQKRGDKSDEVKALQEKLNEAGYDCGKPDGAFGPKTEEALKDWQEDNGYEPDGILWPDQSDDLLGDAKKHYTTSARLSLITDVSALSGALGDTIPVKIRLTNTGETSFGTSGHRLLNGQGEWPLGDAISEMEYWSAHETSEVNSSWLKPGQYTDNVINVQVTHEDIEAGVIIRNLSQTITPLYCAIDGVMTEHPSSIFPEPEGTNGHIYDNDQAQSLPLTFSIPLWTESPKLNLGITIKSLPANGSYYELGETAKFEIDISNPANVTVYGLEVSYADAAGSTLLQSYEKFVGGNLDWLTYEHVVNETDIANGMYSIIALAKAMTEEQEEIKIETDSAMIFCGDAQQSGDGTLTKEIVSTPANGEYYTVGETIEYKISFDNKRNHDLNDLEVVDPLKGGNEDSIVILEPVVEPLGHVEATFGYTVTEADAEAGFVTNTAVAIWWNPEIEEQTGCDSNTVEVPAGYGENDGIVLTKSVVSTAEYYYCGDTVTFAIGIENISDETFYDVIVYDPILDFAELKTYDVMEPGFSDTIEFTYTVTTDDVMRGSVENTAFVIRPGGADFQDRIYSNTVSVITAAKVYTIGDTNYQFSGIEAGKEVSGSVPANGTFFVPGETVSYMITVKNVSNQILHEVTVRDSLYSATEPVTVFADMEPGDVFTASFDYRVTEMDAIRGYVKNVANVIGYDPEGKAQVAFTNEVEVLAGMEGDFPFGVITEMTIVKEETSTPANGSYYTEGETISYLITYTNTGETDFGETLVYDTLSAGKDEIASAEMLTAGDSRICYFDHVVTAADVAKGYVANSAIAKYDIGGGYTNTAVSNVVVSDTDGDPNTTYVPGTGTIDWEKLRGTDGEVADTCYIKAVSRDGDTVDYEVHFCTKHAQTQSSILKMANAAGDEGKQQMVWEYAYALWQKEIDAMYEKILTVCDDAAKITVMSDRLSHLAMVANTQFALNIAEPGQPAETARAVAQLWQEKCIDLCCLMNTAPAERDDSIFAVERAQGTAEAAQSCSCVIAEEAEGKLLYADQYCAAHAFTYEMTELLLMADRSEGTWSTVRSLWEIELNSAYNALNKAAGEEGGMACLAEYAAFMNWLPAHEEFLDMVYPAAPATAAEVLINTIMARALDACGRVK